MNFLRNRKSKRREAKAAAQKKKAAAEAAAAAAASGLEENSEAAIEAAAQRAEAEKRPKLAQFIKNRDYTGAVVLLEFQRQTGESDQATLPWLGYAAFHLGDYRKSLDAYQELLSKAETETVYHLYEACCYFYLGLYVEAREAANKGPKTRLQNRILFHVAHKLHEENTVLKHHQNITNSVEDQLSLASIHYLRSHFQEATDIYKRLLIEHRDYLALQVYVALCYYKLDYYDVSLDILAPYLQANPDSAIAINLKACNHYKLYDGKAAETELKVMTDMLAMSTQSHDNDLVRHNLVVFRNGENALQVLPPLLEDIPEARLNLVIYHMRNNEVMEAYDLIKSLDPTTPQQYILKGVVNAAVGQMNDSREHLKLAQQFFQLVGASASECDTIPGRQCMASCFFLLRQFDDVLVYLNSIKAYSFNDSVFNYNYGIALANTDQYKEAEEALLLVRDDEIRRDSTYLSWLARCFIMNRKPRDAWELYLKMESNTDSYAMLVLIANDCYKVGSFYYAAKAFDVLERLDPDPQQEFWHGKRGACCGVFQMVIAGKERKDALADVVAMLQKSQNMRPNVAFIVRVMSNWLDEN